MPVGINYTFGDDAWRMSQATTSAIQGAMGDVVNLVEDRREKKDAIKVSKELAKALGTLYPETMGAVQPIIDQLDDEEIPLSQRAALGDQIGKLINMGVEKNRNDALMSLERSRLGLEERRVRIAEEAPIREQESLIGAAMSENDVMLNDALSRYTAVTENEAAMGDKLPKMEKSQDLILKYIEQGEGQKALNAVESYEKARIAQMEPLMKPETVKPIKLGGTDEAGMPVEIDAFVTPTGEVMDMNMQPMTRPGANEIDPSLLPPRPDQPGDAPLPPVGNRVPPMPRLGIRPAGTPTPRTQTQEAIDQARLQQIQGEVANQQSTLNKEQATKAASLANAKDAVALVDRLKSHPGFSSAVGTTMTPGFIPATDRKGAEAIINQLKGTAFLNAIQQLRGLGALSDAEGAKLEQAAARLDTKQSEADFKQALDEYRSIVESGIKRLEGQSGAQPPAASATSRLQQLKAAQGR